MYPARAPRPCGSRFVRGWFAGFPARGRPVQGATGRRRPRPCWARRGPGCSARAGGPAAPRADGALPGLPAGRRPAGRDGAGRVRAVVYSGYGVTPKLTQVAYPACPADGAVIAVGATGVCRSDWHAWKGHDPVALPHIGGHELAGVVAAAGPEGDQAAARDRVTVPFVCGCGRCEFCLAGDAQVCPRQTPPGFTGPGSFAELMAIHAADANLVPLPDGVDFAADSAVDGHVTI